MRSDFIQIFLDFFLTLFHFLLLLLQNHPVILIVILITISQEEILEHISHCSILRTLIESQISALAEVFGEFNRISFAKDFD